MQVYHSINEVPYHQQTFLTLGTFDGVHAGHQQIIRRLIEDASGKGRSLLLTFDRHPLEVIRNTRIPLLTPPREKIYILESTGLDTLVMLPFTRDLAEMTAEDFIEGIVIRGIGVCRFVAGYDHAFGRDRRGTPELLNSLEQEYEFGVDVVPPLSIDGSVVSSTLIRELLSDGDILGANRLLGRPYQLKGRVMPGKKLGQKLGFPTANLDIAAEKKLIPGDGVYAAVVEIHRRRMTGTVNIGSCPTVEGSRHQVEVFIHDFQGDLYGNEITLHLKHFLRKEHCFNSMEALKRQIETDVRQSRNFLLQDSRRNEWD